MADSNMQLQWTDEKWNKVRQVVYEEARKARVAGNFLPLYGPLEPDATYVSKQELWEPHSAPTDHVPGFTVTDTETLRLATLQVKVYLRSAQVTDPELDSALIAFRRAANVLAHLEDDIIFNGQQASSEGPRQAGQPRLRSDLWEVRGGQRMEGLLPFPFFWPIPPRARGPLPPRARLAPGAEALVTAISNAVGSLETRHHLGPFACALDHVYFTTVQTPSPRSMVLPQDRILPFLGGGALVRSSVMREQTGVVVALGGAPIDLVVGTDISVSFLQVTEAPLFVFRVYEKIVLRIKQPSAIEPLPENIL